MRPRAMTPHATRSIIALSDAVRPLDLRRSRVRPAPHNARSPRRRLAPMCPVEGTAETDHLAVSGTSDDPLLRRPSCAYRLSPAAPCQHEPRATVDGVRLAI